MRTVEQRRRVEEAYPDPEWVKKVRDMPDKQVHEVYIRLVEQRKIRR